jgi:metallo-beta-lactamase class B
MEVKVENARCKKIKNTTCPSGLKVLIALLAAALMTAACSSPKPEEAEQSIYPTRPTAPRKKIYNPPYSNDLVDPYRIIGNIYYVGMGNYTSFLITTPEGLILLDTMVEDTVPTLQKNIETLGFKVEEIRIILQAHAHIDHVGGMDSMKNLSGARVLVMAEDAQGLADGGVSDFRGDGTQLWTGVEADQLLSDGEKITLGGVTMVAHKTAGHSKGCTTWSTVAEEDGESYDVVFVCSNRVNDGIPMINNPKYPTMIEDYISGFETLKSLPSDVFLGSHAFFFNMHDKLAMQEESPDTNSFIDPDGLGNYIADFETEFLYSLYDDIDAQE